MMKIKTLNLFDIKKSKVWPFIHVEKVSLYRLIFQCLIIGFFGFMLETLVNLIMNGELVDRGFLYGPFIPLYAFSLFFYLLFFKIPQRSFKNFILYFFIMAILITVLEFSVGNLCEILFKSELWNYEDIILSSTYISLPVSLLWGIVATSYLMFIVPLINQLAMKIPFKIIYRFVHICLFAFSIDSIASIMDTIKKGIYQEKYFFYDGLPIFLFIIGLLFYFILIIVVGRFILHQFKNKNKWLGIFFYPPYYLSLLLPLFAIYGYLFRVKSHFIDKLATIGFFTLAVYIYFFMLFFLFLGLKKLILWNKKDKDNNYSTLSVIVLSLVASLVICSVGVGKAKKSFVKEYYVYEDRLTREYNIVVVSDVHYGTTGAIIDINEMAKQINELKPSLLLMLGDIIDNRLSLIDQTMFIEAMKSINTEFGVFSIIGNHDVQLNSENSLIQLYKKANVSLLLDQSIVVDDAFNLLGRRDYSVERKEIGEIKINALYPTIVMDHQPQTKNEAIEKGSFLQLSGHTHQGQIFPYNLFLKLFYMLNFPNLPIYGMKKYDDFSLIISRGYGTWGFPLRTTGRAEIIQIHLYGKINLQKKIERR